MARMERFRWWVIEFIASAVVLVSFLSYRYYLPDDSEWSQADTWIFVVPSISTFLSLLGTVASVFQRDEDSVCRIESILVWTVTALWTIAAVFTTVGSVRTQNVFFYETFISLHPNLYFFSLFAIIIAVILMASWFNQYIHGEDVEHSTSTQWILLGSLSFLAMLSAIAFRDSVYIEETVKDFANGTSVNIINTIPICESEVYTCKRATFAIVWSALSGIVACIMTPWRGSSPKCRADVSIMLFLGWLFGVVFITFGSGPGVRWGSLYFASYMNLFLCLDIIIESTAGNDCTVANEIRPSSVIGHGAIFDAAYTQLERINTESQEKFDRTKSYNDLFESVMLASGSEDEETNHLSGTTRRSSFHETYEESKVNRLELWCILLIESCVNVAAIVPKLSDSDRRSSAEKMVLMLPSLSVVTSCFGFATCMRTKKRSKIIQYVSVTMALLIWVTAVPFLSYIVDSAILGYTLDGSTVANQDANLFFSTWISILVVILLVTNLFQASVVTSDWVLLATFSFALMGSSMVYFRTMNSTETDELGNETEVPLCTKYIHLQKTSCKGVTLSMYLGFFSGITSMIMTLLFRCGPLIHFCTACCLAVFWGTSVAFITFSKKYDTDAGLLYFSCWAGCLLTIDLATMNFVMIVRQYEKKKASREHASQDEAVSS
ncbi:hypothetical protein IV203_031598 [Nitzschia inconspicua]|uniref:Uncharacterized protein n=1 Tax=Nitzschia inconspicua TaxID=303405 RepID=A0A9K3LUN1_9STRA|nr:hypothetical protein IV203_031598 [Nitzschia inconspicua]